MTLSQAIVAARAGRLPRLTPDHMSGSRHPGFYGEPSFWKGGGIARQREHAVNGRYPDGSGTAHSAARLICVEHRTASDFAIVVVGASYGGVEAMERLFADLPAQVPAAILCVLHVGPYPSQLPSILNRHSFLHAHFAREGELIRRGEIYVAPPDHHLLVRRGHLRLSRGPRVNWSRPAIDALFASAAKTYGSSVIGVLLTGRLNDGTAGLYEVKRHGGMTIVQDPSDAMCPGMPASALKHVTVDHCVPLAAMPRILFQVCKDVAARAEEAWRATATGGPSHA
jgi:chemotaxis response regulator CheB